MSNNNNYNNQDYRYQQQQGYPSSNQATYQKPAQQYSGQPGFSQQSRPKSPPVKQFANQQQFYDGSIPIPAQQNTFNTAPVANNSFQYQSDYTSQTIPTQYSNNNGNNYNGNSNQQSFNGSGAQSFNQRGINPNPNQSQQPQFYGQDYLNEFQNSATGQLGMQLGTQAFNTAQEKISSNVIID